MPLSRQQVQDLTHLLEEHHAESQFLVDLLANRVEPGVSQGAQVKATWLEQVALGRIPLPLISPEAAVAMLGQMGGGYNVEALVRLLSHQPVAAGAASALKGVIKVYEAFDMTWHIGEDIAHTPNKRRGGVVIGGTIAPIFYATARDAGLLPVLSIFGQVGCRVETPGCSLGMGNQARVRPHATVISTSTRNFDNRLGDGAQVYLATEDFLNKIDTNLRRAMGL